MPRFQDEPTAFFIFCRDNFATKLSIPKAFAEEHGEFVLQKYVRLKTAESRGFWEVKISRNSKGDFYIGRGWPEFVKDNNILEMHLLVVRIVSASILHITIFGHNACYHRPLSLTKPPSNVDEGVAKTKTCWRFVKELKDYHFNTQRMEIPLTFAVSTGIGEKGEATLKDWRGREWAVKVTNRNIKMYSFTSGWVHFLKANKLHPKTVLLFEFVPNSDFLVNVVVMSNQAGKKLLHQAHAGGLLD